MFNPLTRNIRDRNTRNRYIVDSTSFWHEGLHPRVRDLPILSLIDRINNNVDNGLWVLPLPDGNTFDFKLLLTTFTLDYINMVDLRRLSRRPSDGINLNDIDKEFTSYIIGVLWDVVNGLLFNFYPFEYDDFKLRTGKTFSNDDRETTHANNSVINSGEGRISKEFVNNGLQSGDYRESKQFNNSDVNTGDQVTTIANNTQSSTADSLNGFTSNTVNRDTHDVASNKSTSHLNNNNRNNTNSVTDLFVSPQNQGVTPTDSSTGVEGEEGVLFTGEGRFTTNTSRDTTGVSDDFEEISSNTSQEDSGNVIIEGQTNVKMDDTNRVYNMDFIDGSTKNDSNLKSGKGLEVDVKSNTDLNTSTGLDVNTTTNTDLNNRINLGARAKNYTGLESYENLDKSNTFKNFYDMNKDRVMLELDNRMYPLYLQVYLNVHEDFRNNELFS